MKNEERDGREKGVVVEEVKAKRKKNVQRRKMMKA